MRPLFILFSLWLLTPLFGFSQTDSISAVKDIDQLIRENERKLLSDSIQKSLILFQISELPSWDRIQRRALENELRQININDSVRLAIQALQIKEFRINQPKYPVTLFYDTLFFIQNSMGSVSPRERAERINRQLKELYYDETVVPDSVSWVASENVIDIVYDDFIIMRVLEADALLNEIPLEQLAGNYRESIIKAVNDERNNRSWINILYRYGMLILILVVLVLIIVLIIRLFRFFGRQFEVKKDQWLKQLNIGTYELLSKEQELQWIKTILRILKWLTIILAVYFALPFAFRLFPFSQGWAEKLLELALTPVRKMFSAITGYLPNLFTIAVILLVMKYVNKLVRYIFNEIEAGKLVIPGFYSDWAMPTFSIARFLLLAFTFVLIFPYLPGSDSAVFKGVSVFIGVLFSLGSSTAIANMIAGLVITYMRPFKIGDRIKLGDVSGDVIEKSLLVTRLKTIKNEEITIPNSAILSGNTINYSAYAREQGLIIHTTVTIGYDVPWKQMHQALMDAAGRVDLILKEPAPFVFQTSLEDFYIAYQINAYTHEAGRQSLVLSLLHQSIQDVCNERGIEIMSPHYRAQRDGNASTIPADYVRPENSMDASQ